MPRRGENIRKRKDGRWEARYIKGRKEDGKAIYGYVYAKTYKEVKDKLHNILIDQNKKRDIKKITFNEVADQWFDYKKNFIKQSTYNKYLNTYINYIKEKLGFYCMEQINEKLIQNYIFDLSKNKNYRTDEPLSISTLKIVIYIIRSTINFAHKQKYIKLIQLEIKLPPYEKKPIKILPKKEQKILEKYLITKQDCYSLCILICLYTGMRIGELCALKWNDVDFNNHIIIVHQTIQRIQNKKKKNISKTQLLITKPKTKNSIRRIPITSSLYKIMQNYYIQNHEQPSSFVFRNKKMVQWIQEKFKSISN